MAQKKILLNPKFVSECHLKCYISSLFTEVWARVCEKMFKYLYSFAASIIYSILREISRHKWIIDSEMLKLPLSDFNHQVDSESPYKRKGTQFSLYLWLQKKKRSYLLLSYGKIDYKSFTSRYQVLKIAIKVFLLQYLWKGRPPYRTLNEYMLRIADIFNCHSRNIFLIEMANVLNPQISSH